MHIRSSILSYLLYLLNTWSVFHRTNIDKKDILVVFSFTEDVFIDAVYCCRSGEAHACWNLDYVLAALNQHSAAPEYAARHPNLAIWVYQQYSSCVLFELMPLSLQCITACMMLRELRMLSRVL